MYWWSIQSFGCTEDNAAERIEEVKGLVDAVRLLAGQYVSPRHSIFSIHVCCNTQVDLWDYDESTEVSDTDLSGIRYLSLYDRLGYKSLFNPLLPDGEYILNLAVAEQQRVAQFLVMLTAENGVHLRNASIDGQSFADTSPWDGVFVQWETEVTAPLLMSVGTVYGRYISVSDALI